MKNTPKCVLDQMAVVEREAALLRRMLEGNTIDTIEHPVVAPAILTENRIDEVPNLPCRLVIKLTIQDTRITPTPEQRTHTQVCRAGSNMTDVARFFFRLTRDIAQMRKDGYTVSTDCIVLDEQEEEEEPTQE